MMGRHALLSTARGSMTAASHSSSPLLAAVLFGGLTRGRVLGPHDVEFDGYAMTVTRVGSPRMPNGIECDVDIRVRERVAIGEGRLMVGRRVIAPGPGWDPVPSFPPLAKMLPGPEPLVLGAPGTGRLTPTADEVLAGYVAGIVLLHGQRDRAARIAKAAAARMGAFGATMIQHAGLGEVPEPVHILLRSGDSRPLLALDRPSGHGLLRGLVSAGYVLDVTALQAGRAAAGAG